MTDLPRDLDQLASDLVDGVLPSDEAARLRRDPEVAARVAQIDQLRRAVRSVPPPSPDGAERMIAAAVAAATGPAAATSPPPPVALAPVRSHAAGKPHPGRRSDRGLRPWLAAAAVLVLAGLAAVGALSTSGGSDDADSAAVEAADSSADGSRRETEESTEGVGGSEPGDDSDAPTAGAPTASQPPNLGAVESAEELAARVADNDAGRFQDSDETEDGVGTMSDSGPPCLGLRPAGDPARGRAIYGAQAVYRGAPVRVHLYETDGGTRLVATDLTCVDVVDVAYAG